MLPITELTLIYLKMNIYTKKAFGHQDKNKIINPCLLTDQSALLESLVLQDPCVVSWKLKFQSVTYKKNLLLVKRALLFVSLYELLYINCNSCYRAPFFKLLCIPACIKLSFLLTRCGEKAVAKKHGHWRLFLLFEAVSYIVNYISAVLDSWLHVNPIKYFKQWLYLNNIFLPAQLPLTLTK